MTALAALWEAPVRDSYPRKPKQLFTGTRPDKPVEYVQYLADSLEPATPAEIEQHRQTRTAPEEKREENTPWNVRYARMLARDAEPKHPGAFTDAVQVWVEAWPQTAAIVDEFASQEDDLHEDRVGSLQAVIDAVEARHRARWLARIHLISGTYIDDPTVTTGELAQLYLEAHDDLVAYRNALADDSRNS